MKKLTLILTCIVFGAVYSAKGQTPGVDQRQQIQHNRIRQGVTTGELTRRETAKAVRHQGHIRRNERRAKSDGIVTRRERARLHHMQTRASRDLRSNKHDVQARGRAN